MQLFLDPAFGVLARSARVVGDRRRTSWALVLLGLILIQTNTVLAQGATPSEVTSSEVLKACDLAAANPFDKQRPADIPGVVDSMGPSNALYSRLNPSVAVPACEAAVRAAPQDLRMSFQLARSYRDAKRLAEALSLYQQADQMGSALAAFDLSVMYKVGAGVPVDLKTQLYYLDRAARAGLGSAQNDYGSLYLKGNAVLPKDENLARQLYSLSAQDNYPLGMTDLGWALETGIGGAKDEVEARYWYEKGAQAGDYNGMYLFGYALNAGKGGPQDRVEARKWIEKAANGNNALATNYLGVMFQNGWGGAKDLEEARRQYKKAVALGEKQFAAKHLETLDAAASH